MTIPVFIEVPTVSQWPRVVARLLEALPLLPRFATTPVYDGPEPDEAGNQTLTFCTVGYQRGDDSAGTFSQDRAGNGFQIEETGEVRCEIYAGNGDDSMSDARSGAFYLLDAVQSFLLADQTLGVLPAGSTCVLQVDPISLSTKAGSAQWLPFVVRYFTRT